MDKKKRTKNAKSYDSFVQSSCETTSISSFNRKSAKLRPKFINRLQDLKSKEFSKSRSGGDLRKAKLALRREPVYKLEVEDLKMKGTFESLFQYSYTIGRSEESSSEYLITESEDSTRREGKLSMRPKILETDILVDESYRGALKGKGNAVKYQMQAKLVGRGKQGGSGETTTTTGGKFDIKPRKTYKNTLDNKLEIIRTKAGGTPSSTGCLMSISSARMSSTRSES